MSDWQWGAINSRNQLPGNRRNQLAFFYCPPLHSQPPYLIYTFAGYNRNLQFGPKKDIWYVKCWIEAKPAPMWIKLNMVFSDVMSWHCCHSMVRDWFSLVGLLEFELLWAPPLSSCVMIIWFGQFCRFGLVWFGLLSFVGLIEAGLSITVWQTSSPPSSDDIISERSLSSSSKQKLELETKFTISSLSPTLLYLTQTFD